MASNSQKNHFSCEFWVQLFPGCLFSSFSTLTVYQRQKMVQNFFYMGLDGPEMAINRLKRSKMAFFLRICGIIVFWLSDKLCLHSTCLQRWKNDTLFLWMLRGPKMANNRQRRPKICYKGQKWRPSPIIWVKSLFGCLLSTIHSIR